MPIAMSQPNELKNHASAAMAAKLSPTRVARLRAKAPAFCKRFTGHRSTDARWVQKEATFSFFLHR
jgi:hypothetical protein